MKTRFVVLSIALFWACLAHAQDNSNSGRGQQLASALLGFLDNMAAANNQAKTVAKPQCIPYKLPAGYKTYQDYCKSLSIADDAYWDQKYKEAPNPRPGETIPLKGCVLGCIVGRDAFQRGLRWGAGAWSGKCIRNGADVMNLLTPLPSIGGMFNVLDTLNWTQFLPATEQYPGTIGMGASWWDAYNSLTTQSGKLGTSFTITYDEVPEPQYDETSSILDRTVGTYAQLVRGTRDEMRQVEPGMMLGQMFRRPNSFMNPTPIPVNSGIRFAMFQVCDKQGKFANGGNSRDLRGTS